MRGKCIFCKRNVKMDEEPSTEIYRCDCPNCGAYRITREARDDLPFVLEKNYPGKEHLVSGYLREVNDLGLKPELITVDSLDSILSDTRVPKTIIEKLNKITCHIYRKTSYIYEELDVNLESPAVGYAKDKNELMSMLMALKDTGVIKTERSDNSNSITIKLTLEGLKEAESICQQAVNGRQVFVAIWFDEKIKKVFHDHVLNAIEEIGYKAIIIDMVEHNDKICDQIIVEIKKSKFLIADFTGNRGGVYFEAGLAYGLGMPVIWTCRKDHFNDVHFDIEHYNFIIWETGEELAENLKNRILATIPNSV